MESAERATRRLNLDPAVVREARELARRAGQPIVELARTHTTVSVERAVLRLAGLHGADPDGMPWVNALADAVGQSAGLAHGVALPVWDALLTGGYPGLAELAADAASRRARTPARRARRHRLPWPAASPRSTRSVRGGRR